MWQSTSVRYIKMQSQIHNQNMVNAFSNRHSNNNNKINWTFTFSIHNRIKPLSESVTISYKRISLESEKSERKAAFKSLTPLYLVCICIWVNFKWNECIFIFEIFPFNHYHQPPLKNAIFNGYIKMTEYFWNIIIDKYWY